MDTTYSISAAGVEEFLLFPPCPEPPAPSDSGQRLPDQSSGYRARPVDRENEPTRTRVKKSHYTPREQALRGLQVREFIRDQYLPTHRLKVSTLDDLNVLLGHLARCRGQTFVRELNDELLQSALDYFLTQIADGEMGAANANKNLRYLKSLANYAHLKKLVRRPITFSDFLEEPRPEPRALTREEYWKIGQAARAVTGAVSGVPAPTWWYAWYLTMSRVGNRLTAMMYAERRHYQHGVLHLIADNQKQDEDQRLQLPDYAQPAIEDLLAAHDQPRIFPWPFDKPKPGKRQNWKTLFSHFRAKLVKPAGIELKPGVLTRVFRQTVATMIDCAGGNATKQLGHSSPVITKKHYLDKSQTPVTTGALLIPQDQPPPPPPGKQQTLFAKDG
jgi:integrase